MDSRRFDGTELTLLALAVAITSAPVGAIWNPYAGLALAAVSMGLGYAGYRYTLRVAENAH